MIAIRKSSPQRCKHDFGIGDALQDYKPLADFIELMETLSPLLGKTVIKASPDEFRHALSVSAGLSTVLELHPLEALSTTSGETKYTFQKLWHQSAQLQSATKSLLLQQAPVFITAVLKSGRPAAERLKQLDFDNLSSELEPSFTAARLLVSPPVLPPITDKMQVQDVLGALKVYMQVAPADLTEIKKFSDDAEK